jgi:hypothetical protein
LDKSVQQLLLVAPVLLFSMVAHEYAHGYAALKQGDTTAYSLGRLTWNPIPHIDPFMTILLPLLTYFTTGIAFGGAKPVPVIPRNYRNFKRGDIIVSLAGVATNFVIAICCIPLIILVGFIGRIVPALQSPSVPTAVCRSSQKNPASKKAKFLLAQNTPTYHSGRVLGGTAALRLPFGAGEPHFFGGKVVVGEHFRMGGVCSTHFGVVSNRVGDPG